MLYHYICNIMLQPNDYNIQETFYKHAEELPQVGN